MDGDDRFHCLLCAKLRQFRSWTAANEVQGGYEEKNVHKACVDSETLLADISGWKFWIFFGSRQKQ